MKHIYKYYLVFIFLSSTFSTHAQTWALTYFINFDSGYIYRQNINLFTIDTNYLNYEHLLIIDTIHYHHNQWQIGKPDKTFFNTAYSYPNAIITDTLLPCIPNDTSVFILKVPKAAWLTLGEFSFKFRLNIDSNDISTIELSSDTGLNWTNILTDSSGAFSFGYMVAKPDLSISTTGWDSIKIYPGNMSIFEPWEIDTFLFRFTFITDSSNESRDGWMIDNFMIGYPGEGVSQINNNSFLSYYPNPAIGTLTITASYNITNIAITNLLGYAVYTQEYNSKTAQVDISEIPRGVYFVKINGSEVRKFVKE